MRLLPGHYPNLRLAGTLSAQLRCPRYSVKLGCGTVFGLHFRCRCPQPQVAPILDSSPTWLYANSHSLRNRNPHPRNTPTICLTIDLGWFDGACRLGPYYQARPFIAPTALVSTLRAPQKPSCSQLLRGILVDHDVLHGGEALLDGIVGALGYRVGIHQS